MAKKIIIIIAMATIILAGSHFASTKKTKPIHRDYEICHAANGEIYLTRQLK